MKKSINKNILGYDGPLTLFEILGILILDVPVYAPIMIISLTCSFIIVSGS